MQLCMSSGNCFWFQFLLSVYCRTILGQENTAFHLAVRYLTEQTQMTKPALYSICLKDCSVQTLKAIKEIILQNKTWWSTVIKLFLWFGVYGVVSFSVWKCNIMSGKIFRNDEQLWTAYHRAARKWQDNILSCSEQVPWKHWQESGNCQCWWEN